MASIERATERGQLHTALNRFVSRRTKQTNQSAVSTLRSNGLYSVANEVESFFQTNEHSAFSRAGEESFTEVQSQARELVNKMETAFNSMSKSQVRRSTRQTRSKAGVNSKAKVRRGSQAVQKVVMLLVAGLAAFSISGNAFADSAQAEAGAAKNSGVVGEPNSGEPGYANVSLSKSQQETIIKEAGSLYADAMAVVENDAAEANDLFTSAAAKYQLLVDSGISNSRLYTNLGNAYLQSNQLGQGIVNYERAIRIDPTNRQLSVNLELANSLVKGQSEAATQDDGSASTSSISGHLRNANSVVINFVGRTPIVWALAISSMLFWGLMIVSTLAKSVSHLPLKRIAIAPLLVLVLTATSYGLSNSTPVSAYNGIIVANNVTLHSGDGQQFDEVATLETSQGHRVKYLDRRGDWAKIETALEQSGWISSSDVEEIGHSPAS